MLVLNQFIRGQGKHICIRTYILRILFIYFLLLKIHTLTKSLNYRNKSNTEILKKVSLSEHSTRGFEMGIQRNTTNISQCSPMNKTGGCLLDFQESSHKYCEDSSKM